MAAWGYEFYLLVLKESLTRSLEEKIRIPARPCNILYLLHRRSLILRMAEVRIVLLRDSK